MENALKEAASKGDLSIDLLRKSKRMASLTSALGLTVKSGRD
jgi:hypothetical protein